MKTKHLDSIINQLETLRSKSYLADNGLEMLSEFNQIKQALTLPNVVKPFYCHSEEAGGFRCGEQCLGCDVMERDKKQ